LEHCYFFLLWVGGGGGGGCALFFSLIFFVDGDVAAEGKRSVDFFNLD